MTDHDDFLAWVKSALNETEVAIHNGDAAPRRALWSRNEPVSVLGAWRNAFSRQDVDESFTFLERSSRTAHRSRLNCWRMTWWVIWPIPPA
jgi:hypothetical protein